MVPVVTLSLSVPLTHHCIVRSAINITHGNSSSTVPVVTLSLSVPLRHHCVVRSAVNITQGNSSSTVPVVTLSLSVPLMHHCVVRSSTVYALLSYSLLYNIKNQRFENLDYQGVENANVLFTSTNVVNPIIFFFMFKCQCLILTVCSPIS